MQLDARIEATPGTEEQLAALEQKATILRENYLGSLRRVHDSQLAEHLRHVHLEDIAASRVHQHLVPGHGAIDFAAVFAALRKIGYDGWVTVELYPYRTTAAAVAREALNFIEPLLE